jgi:hypothetical protein
VDVVAPPVEVDGAVPRPPNHTAPVHCRVRTVLAVVPLASVTRTVAVAVMGADSLGNVRVRTARDPSGSEFAIENWPTLSPDTDHLYGVVPPTAVSRIDIWPLNRFELLVCGTLVMWSVDVGAGVDVGAVLETGVVGDGDTGMTMLAFRDTTTDVDRDARRPLASVAMTMRL